MKLDKLLEAPITIGGDKSKGDAFLDEMYSLYAPHPFTRNALVIDNMAVVEVSTFGEEADIWLTNLYSVQRGGGRYGLTAICKLADRFKVSIALSAVPCDSLNGKKMETADLIMWYKSFGFNLSESEYGYDTDMIRQPQV